MTKLSRVACALVVFVACNKAETKPTPKPVEEPKPAPVPVKVEPKPAPPPPPAKTATESDEELVAKVDDIKQFPFKPAPDTSIDMEVKARIKNGKQVVDVLAAGKLIDTIDSDLDKDEFGMEMTYRIGATREGVMAVVTAVKTTGKPADYYKARVYTWDATSKKMVPGRKIEFENVYDPARDGL